MCFPVNFKGTAEKEEPKVYDFRADAARLRSADAQARVERLAEQRRHETLQQKDAAKAQADAAWFGRAPRAPLGVAKAQRLGDAAGGG
eukprot:Skav224812  [mRNA]  locus=scaffold21:16909:21951:+ [translate_table: standard]